MTELWLPTHSEWHVLNMMFIPWVRIRMNPGNQGQQPGDEPTGNSKAGQNLPIAQASRLSRAVRAWLLMHQASEDLVLSIKTPSATRLLQPAETLFVGQAISFVLCRCKVLECLYHMTRTEKLQAHSICTHTHMHVLMHIHSPSISFPEQRKSTLT